MATEKQIEANRRNAALSTGPKTVEGKARSRGNAITHGLTAVVVVPVDEHAVSTRRLAAWHLCLQPEDEIQEFQLQLAVAASLRIENCQARERQRKVELAEIATDTGSRWAIDRDKEAAKLGKSLKRNPEEIALQLRCSPAGRAWLITRWKFLLMAVAEGQSQDQKHGWSNTESHLALDLLGKPKVFRDLVLGRENPFLDPVATRVLILREIAKLEADQSNSVAEDAKLRSLHVRGLIFETDALLTTIRRYETSAQRQFNKALKAIHKAKTNSAIKPTQIVASNRKPNPILTPVELAVSPGKASPESKSKPISVTTAPESAPVVESVAEPTLKPRGNRLYRRQLQKQDRHNPYLARIAG